MAVGFGSRSYWKYPSFSNSLPNVSVMAFLNYHSHIIYSSASSVNLAHQLHGKVWISPDYLSAASVPAGRHTDTWQFLVGDPLIRLFVLLLSIWNGYNILKSWHTYYISKRVSLYSQNSRIVWAVNRIALWKLASILPCLSSYLNKDCLVFTLSASGLLLRCGSKLLNGGLDGAGWMHGLRQMFTQGSSALPGRRFEGWLQLVALLVPVAELDGEFTRSLARRADVLY